VPELM